jgi:hypothetical protein
MALKRDSKTQQWLIKSDKDLVEALEMHQDFVEGMAEDIRDCNMLREAATAYMTQKNMKQITLSNGKVKKLVERMTRKWIGTRADLKAIQATDDVIPLKEIVAGTKVERNGKWVPLWNVITKRVIDPDKLDEVIAAGTLSEEEVAPAFVEIPQKPFIQM